MLLFDWREAGMRYGGLLYRWKPVAEQAEFFPEIVVVQPTSLVRGNLTHVSEYVELERGESGSVAPSFSLLPWE